MRCTVKAREKHEQSFQKSYLEASYQGCVGFENPMSKFCKAFMRICSIGSRKPHILNTPNLKPLNLNPKPNTQNLTTLKP